MKLERVKLWGRNYYSVNGKPIARDTLRAIGAEIFTPDCWAAIQNALDKIGSAQFQFIPSKTHRDALSEADNANKKIAALERRIAELTLNDVYRNA